jgi:hypothetical protein
MRLFRESLGLDCEAFAALIGYTGTAKNNERRVRRIEGGDEPVPLYIARLLWLVGEHLRLTTRLPVWPDWPGYDYDHSPDSEHEAA